MAKKGKSKKSRKSKKAPKWEYKLLTMRFGRTDEQSDEPFNFWYEPSGYLTPFNEKLNEEGKRGWELVSLTNVPREPSTPEPRPWGRGFLVAALKRRR